MRILAVPPGPRAATPEQPGNKAWADSLQALGAGAEDAGGMWEPADLGSTDHRCQDPESTKGIPTERNRRVLCLLLRGKSIATPLQKP